MNCNRIFAERTGMTPEMMEQADSVYAIISDALNGMYAEEHTEKLIESCEYVLQALFGFSLDNTKHRYTREYKFCKFWDGRKFKCNTTGKILELHSSEISEGAFIQWGQAYIDLGRLHMYSRFSNCTEVVEEE